MVPEVTVRELLSCSDPVQRLMFGGMRASPGTKREVRLNSIGLSKEQLHNYMASTPKVKVGLEGGYQVKALLDTGAKINVII